MCLDRTVANSLSKPQRTGDCTEIGIEAECHRVGGPERNELAIDCDEDPPKNNHAMSQIPIHPVSR